MNFDYNLLPEGYTYEHCAGTSLSISFCIKEVDCEESANVWVEAFQEKSKITWRVLRTYSCAGKRNVYRKDYRCQHRTDIRYRQKNKYSSQNTGCQATLKIVIRSPQACEQKKEIQCLCILQSEHNHCLDSAAVLRFRSMPFDTKDKLLKYFMQGLSVSAARHALQTDLLLSKDLNYEETIADAAFLPSIASIQYLFNKEFEKLYGIRKGEESLTNLQNLLTTYTANCDGKAELKILDNNVVVAICSPIMQRIIKYTPEVHELIMVDASGNMDKLNHRIYFFVSPCTAGGMPIGCIITNAESEFLFKQGILLLKDCMNDEKFKSKGPVVFLTDGDMKERRALSEVWNKSTFLLCHFHVLKAAWAWLSDKNHGILKEERQEVYFIFKSLLYSDSEEVFNDRLTAMVNNNAYKRNKKLQKYMEMVLSGKHLWAAYFRKGLPIRGNNTSNYVESLFRVLKDCIFERVKALNLVQLVDFIITKYEMYLRNKLLDFSYNKYTKSMLKKFSPVEKISYNITYDENNSFYIVSNDKGLKYHVDIERWLCTCQKGSTGALCSHMSLVFLKYEEKTKSPWYTEEARSLFYKIATGNEPQNRNLLKPLTFNPNNSENNPDSSKCNPDNSKINPDLTTSSHNLTESVNDTQELLIADKPSSARLHNVKEEFEKIIERIRSGISENPETFVPAVEKMIKNTVKFASNESGLVSALHNFAKYSGHKALSTVTLKQIKRRGTQIAVQPTAVGRRKTTLTGKRRQLGGRPSAQKKTKAIKDHDYTTFGDLPVKKRKAAHNITQCVYQNVSIGRSHATK